MTLTTMLRAIVKLHLKQEQKSEVPCLYCGEIADDVERLRCRTMEEKENIRIPICFECDVLAEIRIYPTIKDKQKAIVKNLMRKYKKFYDFPDWDEEELLDIQGHLRQQTKSAMEAKKWIRKRIQWSSQSHVKDVVKILEEHDHGSDFVKSPAEITFITQRLLKELLSWSVKLSC